jgi:F0F1-type ATP synthase membrane subunit a
MNVYIKVTMGQKELLMEPNEAQSVVDTCATATVSNTKDQLVEFLTDNTMPLLSTIRSYVLRMGLARGEAVPTMALEVLQFWANG